MKFYPSIQSLHIEPTSKCNARCPQCLRQWYGTKMVNPGVVEGDLSVDVLRKRVTHAKLPDVRHVLINGNYGDIVMHSQPHEFVQHIRSEFPVAAIQLNTNGSGLSKSFWKLCAELDIEIVFALDGLEDTHHLYRRNTSFKQILKNAKAYIDAGGCATWMMTVFEHNQNQIDECKQLAKEYGFTEFVSRINSRHNGKFFTNVLDSNFNFEYSILPADIRREAKNIDVTEAEADEYGEEQAPWIKSRYEQLIATDVYISEDTLKDKIQEWKSKYEHTLSAPVRCRAKESREVYISANGILVPCCFLGLQRTAPKVHLYEDIKAFIEKAGDTLESISIHNNDIQDIVQSNFFMQLQKSFHNVNGDRLMQCSQVCSDSSDYNFTRRSRDYHKL